MILVVVTITPAATASAVHGDRYVRLKSVKVFAVLELRRELANLAGVKEDSKSAVFRVCSACRI